MPRLVAKILLAVQDVVDALNKQTTVHYLNLDGNTLGVEAAKAIGEGLKRHPEFRKALWKNLFVVQHHQVLLEVEVIGG